MTSSFSTQALAVRRRHPSTRNPMTTKPRASANMWLSRQWEPDTDDLADEFLRRAREAMSGAGWEGEPDTGATLGRRHRWEGLGRFRGPVGRGFVARVLFDSTGPDRLLGPVPVPPPSSPSNPHGLSAVRCTGLIGSRSKMEDHSRGAPTSHSFGLKNLSHGAAGADAGRDGGQSRHRDQDPQHCAGQPPSGGTVITCARRPRPRTARCPAVRRAGRPAARGAPALQTARY